MITKEDGDINPLYRTFLKGKKEEKTESDNVNHPQHYNKDGIECLDVIKAFYGKEAFEGFCAGNMLKYAMRYRHKGQALDDLKKIRFYADEIIKMYENTESK